MKIDWDFAGAMLFLALLWALIVGGALWLLR